MALLYRLIGGSTASRRMLALGLLPILVVLAPLADARPPDPTWITGIYDAGDFDEVVVAVISATAVFSRILLPSRNPVDLTAGFR
jgi:hypothetical protein